LFVIDAISGAETQVSPWNFPWETPNEGDASLDEKKCRIQKYSPPVPGFSRALPPSPPVIRIDLNSTGF